MTDDLKPCPFCGSSGYDVKILSGMGEYWGHCFECKSSSTMQNSYEEALKSWDTRPPSQQFIEGVDEIGRLLTQIYALANHKGDEGFENIKTLTGKALALFQKGGE